MSEMCQCVDGACVACGRAMKRCHAKRHCRRVELQRRPAVPRTYPGSVLARGFRLLGVNPDSQCSCKSVSRLMDAAGSRWCIENAWMLAGNIRENARKRGMRVPLFAGWLAVLLASVVAKLQAD